MRGALIAVLLSATLAVACAPASPPAAVRPAEAPPAASVPPAPAAPPAPIPMRVAYAAVAAGQAPVWVAYEQGLLREYGLDAELVFLNSTRTDQGIVTGETPIGFGANVIAVRLSGADIVSVAGVTNRIPYTWLARPPIATPQDLRGRTMVVSRPGAAITLAAEILLRHFGLEPHRDVALQPGGSTPEQVAMVLQGFADSVMISPPASLKAMEAGLVPIAKVSDLDIPFLGNSVGTTSAYAREHSEEVRRFLRAYVAAVGLMRREPDVAKAAISKYVQINDPEALDDAYWFYRESWGRPDFRVQPEAVASILRVLDAPGADTARPEDFIDNRFIDELHASGFVRQVGAD
jgi:NitT/TauT family transport system substrate-binding protein